MKKIIKIENAEDGSGYLIFFSDYSVSFASKLNGEIIFQPAYNFALVKIVYNGREYKG